MLFDDVVARDRRLRVAAAGVRKMPGFDPILAEAVARYLDAYCRFYNLSAEAVIASYSAFTERYLQDLTRFQATGLYPAQLDPAEPIDRTSYDLALMLSYLVAEHRFRLLQLTLACTKSIPTAVIGCGSGLEVFVLRTMNAMMQMKAYDLKLSAFCVEHNESVQFIEAPFAGGASEQIIAIELLEHLQDPFPLLEQIADAKRALFTTAHNMPQFDHLYNFSEFEVEDWLDQRGVRPAYVEKIGHRMLGNSTECYNKFYLLEAS